MRVSRDSLVPFLVFRADVGCRVPDGQYSTGASIMQMCGLGGGGGLTG